MLPAHLERPSCSLRASTAALTWTNVLLQGYFPPYITGTQATCHLKTFKRVGHRHPSEDLPPPPFAPKRLFSSPQVRFAPGVLADQNPPATAAAPPTIERVTRLPVYCRTAAVLRSEDGSSERGGRRRLYRTPREREWRVSLLSPGDPLFLPRGGGCRTRGRPLTRLEASFALSSRQT